MGESVGVPVGVRVGLGVLGVGGGVGRVVEMWRRVVVWVLLVGCLWEYGCMGITRLGVGVDV